MNPETENNLPEWDYNCDADAGADADSGGWASAGQDVDLAADCSGDDGGICAHMEE